MLRRVLCGVITTETMVKRSGLHEYHVTGTRGFDGWNLIMFIFAFGQSVISHLKENGPESRILKDDT
jgi:hypothetical protein